MSNIPGKVVHRISNNPADLLRLMSPREIGYDFAAHIAYIKTSGRLEPLTTVLVAVYGETPFSDIVTAISSGKGVILFARSGVFAYLCVVSESFATFRSILSENTYTEYSVTSADAWSANSINIGEETPTAGSNKLLTSGGAYSALQGKVNSTNVAEGTYTKVTVNSQGAVTAGTSLDAADIPGHSAATLTSGTLDPNRLGDNTIPVEKLEAHKGLMVDGDTITATESLNSVVLNALPALSRICEGTHSEGSYWIDPETGKVMTLTSGASTPSEAYSNFAACLTDIIQRVVALENGT